MGAFWRGTFHIDFLVGLAGLLPSIPEDKRWEEVVSGRATGGTREEKERSRARPKDGARKETLLHF